MIILTPASRENEFLDESKRVWRRFVTWSAVPCSVEDCPHITNVGYATTGPRTGKHAYICDSHIHIQKEAQA